MTTQKRVVIDSRDRDEHYYPLPARYEVRLEDDLEDVVEMTLVVADIPFCAYTVSAQTCAVPVSFALTNTTAPPIEAGVAELEVGDYPGGATEVAPVLAMALNVMASSAVPTAVIDTHFTVETVARTDSLLIRCQTPFTLGFGSSGTPHNAARVLGFSPNKDYSSVMDPAVPSHPHALRAPYRFNKRPVSYVLLSITTPGAELLQSNNNATNRAFAVLPCRQSTEMSINASNDNPFTKRWNPPLARVARVAVTITDYDGVLYDFQNQDHRLELIFTCMQHRKYSHTPF